jgi:hypothetical protein
LRDGRCCGCLDDDRCRCSFRCSWRFTFCFGLLIMLADYSASDNFLLTSYVSAVNVLL